MASERIGYIDFFRGIGIILMIMGHIGFGTAFTVFIHAFHMPMFFILSGFFYKKNATVPTIKYINHKFQKILIPYLFVGFIFFLLQYIAPSGFSEFRGLSHLTSLLFVNNNGGLYCCGAIWFLTAFFFTNVLYFIIDKYLNKRWLRYSTIVLIACGGGILTKYLGVNLPFSLNSAFVGVGLMEIGKALQSERFSKILNLRFLQCLLLCTISVILIGANYYFAGESVNMRTGSYGFLPLFWINATLATIAGMNLSRLVFEKENRFSTIRNTIKIIGKDSIVFLCFNQSCIKLVNYVFDLLHLTPMVPKLVLSTLTLICVVVILFAEDWLIKHSIIKKCFGF